MTGAYVAPWGLVLSPIVMPHHTVSKTATALVRKYYRSIFSAGNKISKSHFVEADQSGGVFCDGHVGTKETAGECARSTDTRFSNATMCIADSASVY